MVAVSFGSYASDAVADNADWVKPFAVLILLVMAALNILGSHVVARAQTVVVVVVVGILIVFSIATLSQPGHRPARVLGISARCETSCPAWR